MLKIMKYLLSILAMFSIGLFASCSEEAKACCDDPKAEGCCAGGDHDHDDEGNSTKE